MTSDQSGPMNKVSFTPPPARVSTFDPRQIDPMRSLVPYKTVWDGLALGQICLRRDLTAQQKKACLKFYFDAAGIGNLYASLTRCGSHWSFLSIHVALDLAAGGDGNYDYVDDLWIVAPGFRYTKLDWRTPMGRARDIGPVTDPIIFHTHHPYSRLRSARLDEMQIAVTLRNLSDSIVSKFYKLGGTPDNPTEEDALRFRWDSYIMDAIEFYNSWGVMSRRHRNLRVFRYEDLLTSPVDAHKELTDHWGLGLPYECLEEAFKLTTKEAMAKKLKAAGIGRQTRVSFRDKNAPLPDFARNRMLELIDKHLVYDFGFEFR